MNTSGILTHKPTHSNPLSGWWSWSYVRTDGQSASLPWCRVPDCFPVSQFWVSWCGAPSLMRGWVCNLLVQLLLGLGRLPQPGGPGPRIYIPQEQCGPVIPLGTGFHCWRLTCHLPSSSSCYFVTDGQSAKLSWCRSPSEAHDQIFITAVHLRSSCCGAPYLTRGRVCNLLIQFAVILRSKSSRTLCHLRLLGSLFDVSYYSQRYGGGILSRLHMGRLSSVKSQSQSHVTTDGQSVSMSWCRVHSGTCDQILFSVWKLLLSLWGALSDEMSECR
jgi:hypothetical protein